MKKPVIAVDVDDVLFPFLANFIDHHNAVYGTRLSTAHITDTYEAMLGLSLAEMNERIYGFHMLEDLHLAPIADSQVVIEALARKYDLHIVTARHPKFEYRTLAWIDKYFPGMFQSVTHIGYGESTGIIRTKAEVCRKINASVLIDDAIYHLTGCAEAEMWGVWFGNYPYQRGKTSLPPHVVACRDWSEVLEYFDERDG